MKNRIFLLLLVVLIASLLISACSSSSSSSGSSGSTLDGKALVESRCTVCHSLDRVTSSAKTEAEWTSTVERMIGHGAQLSDAEKAAVISYLAATYK